MASVAYREPLSITVGKRMIFTAHFNVHLTSAQQPHVARDYYTGRTALDLVTLRPVPSWNIQYANTPGPDYIKDHLPQVQQHTSYIGEKRSTLERTGDLSYLWRPASHISLPAKYKHEYVGEIGWGIPEYDFINKTRLKSGFHIKHKELTRAAIDEISHRYQNPWQPKPYVMDMLGRFSRGRIAWNMSDYENTNLRNSRGASLVRQSKAALPRASNLPTPPKPAKKEV